MFAVIRPAYETDPVRIAICGDGKKTGDSYGLHSRHGLKTFKDVPGDRSQLIAIRVGVFVECDGKCRKMVRLKVQIYAEKSVEALGQQAGAYQKHNRNRELDHDEM